MPKPGTHTEQESGVLVQGRKKVQKPPMFKVLLHNDDFTTMEFVVMILETVFNKSPDLARKIMLAVHMQGVGIAGVFTHEVAEAKVAKVKQLALKEQFPLLCTMEEE